VKKNPASPDNDTRTSEVDARLAAIVENSDDAILSEDLDGIITSWNGGAERIFGYSASEAVGRSISILMPPDSLDDMPGILDVVERGSTLDRIETMRVRKDGVRIIVSVTISPIRDRSGKVIGASKIARDITAQKKAQQDLRDSEERFRSTFEQAAVGIAHVGVDGRWLRVNERL